MNFDRLAERARRPFWRPSWNSPLPATFFTLNMISMDSSTPKTYIKTPNSSLQDRCRWSYIGYKCAAAILNYNFLPHIWNVFTSFFPISCGSLPYKDQESKLGDMWLHTGPFSAPGLIGTPNRTGKQNFRFYQKSKWRTDAILKNGKTKPPSLLSLRWEWTIMVNV